MQPETVQNITEWAALLTLVLAIIGSVAIVGTAVYQSLKARQVRWDALAFALVLLWSLPYGIRNYGPALLDASIDLINNVATKRDPLEAALQNLIGDTASDVPIMPSIPTVSLDTTQPTIIITSTPWPTAQGVTAVTATPMPTTPPQPTIKPTATVYICLTAQDVLSGCQPPTPVPGN